jgi:multidrug resistance protein MdtO
MTGLIQLEALFGAVAFISIWIALGSPRVAYAGWQILLAFGLTTLQGYGPTLDMQAARDRVIGILLGNFVITLVFVFVWPMRIGDAIRRDIAAAFEALGKLMGLEADTAEPNERREAEQRLRDAFMAAVTHVGTVVPDDRFEPGEVVAGGAGRLGRSELANLSRLIVPVSAIATDGLEPWSREAIPPHTRDEVRAFHRAMQDWFGQAGAWVRTGQDQARLRATLPRAPLIANLPATVPPTIARRIRGRAALYALLLRQIGAFLDDALPPGPARSVTEAERSATLVAG